MKLFKKAFFRKMPMRGSNQSGQAMIEYILVVIISVTLLLSAKGLFSNINTYMSSYIGGYFKCLMTQGELPALGVTDADLSKHTSAGYKCSASLNKTDIASTDSGGGKNVGITTSISNPKPVVGSTKESASRRAGYNASSSSSSSAANKKNKRRNGMTNSESDDDNGTRFSSNIHNRSDAYSSSDAESDGSTTTSPIPRGQLSPDNSERYRAISTQMDEDIKKKTRGGGLETRSKTARKITLREDDNRPGPRRMTFKPPDRSVAAIEEEAETEMGFGYFLKWIMIAGIGIAIFIFFGGQIMNYNNSDS